MSKISCILGPRGLVVGTLVALGTWEIGAFAAGPDNSPAVAQASSEEFAQAGADKAPKAEPEKRFAFEMRGTPWEKVMEWLVDISGIPFGGPDKPTGTFNFITPKNRKEGYTLPEIIDILNESLTSQNFVIIRRSQTYTMVPSDKPIDPAILPRIGLDELNQHGRTEVVSVTLPLKALMAEDTAKEVNQMIGPFGKVVALNGPNQLLIQDTVGNIKRIKDTIQGMEDNEKSSDSFKYNCINIDAEDAEKALKQLLPNPPTEAAQQQGQQQQGGRGFQFPFQQMQQQPAAAPAAPTLNKRAVNIAVDERLNAVLVTGPADRLAQARKILRELDVVPGSESSAATGRVIKLPGGASGAALAEELERMLKEMYPQSPIKVITPGSEKKTEPMPKPAPPPSDRKDKSARADLEDGAIYYVSQIVDPQQKPAPQVNPQQGPPITITAVGNRLIVTCDDPKMVSRINDMIRLLTQNANEQGPFEVLRLKNANAAEIAKELDEAYNGPRQQAQQGGRGFPFPFPQMQQQGPPANQKIRVVADIGSNSLLIKANLLDLLEIKKNLRDVLDNEKNESKATMKSHLIGPLKNATATEVASTIRDVYREMMNQNAVVQVGFGGPGGFGFQSFRGRGQQTLNVDANGNPRQVALTIGVEDRTNTLIVNCSDALYEDINKLVKQLDEAAGKATKTIRVVALKGIDPTVVQQAIDAIQGRRTNFRQGQGGQGFQGGGFGQGGGGFNPGFGGGRGGPQGSLGNPGPRLSPDVPDGGPGFFVERVKDDPQPSGLFDPQHLLNDGQHFATSTSAEAGQEAQETPNIRVVSAEEQQPATAPPPTGLQGETIRGPRSPVTAEALPELGGIIISGNNPEDVELIMKVIEMIQRDFAGAEVQVERVDLLYADPTSVATTLTQLFQRVQFTPTGNVAGPPTTRPGTPTGQAPGLFGQPAQFGQAATTPSVATAALPTGAGNVVLLPLPRFNALLIAAPRARLKDVIQEIKRLDQPTSASAHAVAFPLKIAAASRVDTFLNNFWAQRYPGETATQHQIRITHYDPNNTVYVQAAPADLAEIRDVIDRLDKQESFAINDLRIIYLQNSLSDELEQLLTQAILQGATPIAAPTPVRPVTPGLPGVPGFPGAPTTPAPTTPVVPATTTGASTVTKSTTLRFISGRPGLGIAQSGLLEDIHITSDPRINALIISAPAKTMELLARVIADLDVPPQARANVKVITLKRADAGYTAQIIQQIFLGTTATAPTGAGGGGAGGATVTIAPSPAAPGFPRAVFTLGPVTPTGAPVIPLSLAVDTRTNSLILAGSPNDIDVIQILVSRLEDATLVHERRHEVIALRNASAPDVANALQGFITNSLTVFSRAGELSAFEEMMRDIVIVPEPFTNKLLVSATPHYFNQLLRLIEALDEQPPQVVIQVLVAEVDLNVAEEFGVEIGLQSPVLFNRSVFPAPPFVGTGTNVLTNTGATTNLVQPGVTVNTTNPVALQGFNFNNASNFALPLGSNPVVNPGVVGFQGLSNLGVGRTSPTLGVGGFVFSASSDVFNLLIRALKVQGRMDVLSRPQVMATNNQVATLSVGQNVPIITSTSVSLGTTSTNIERLAVGVNLSVIPRINPDGTVLMHVKPEVSSIISQTVPLGNGIFGTSYNDQTVETTVLAGDGETVAIGGLIQKSDKKSENKVPWLGDLPYLGTLFRFRTQDKTKSELIIILTPHIVRSRADADRILAEEAKRMDWIIGDVIKTQGSSGLAPILPAPPSGGGPFIPGEAPLIAPPGTALPSVEIVPDPAGQRTLPTPRKALPPITPPLVPPAAVVPMSSSAGRFDPGVQGSAYSSAPLPVSPAATLPSTTVSLPPADARAAPGAMQGAAALPTTVILPENTPPVSATGTPATTSPGGYVPGVADSTTAQQAAPNPPAGSMPAAGADPARPSNNSDKEKSRLWKIFHPGQ